MENERFMVRWDDVVYVELINVFVWKRFIWLITVVEERENWADS